MSTAANARNLFHEAVSPTLAQIEAVMASHRRLTGQAMDWRTAVRRLDTFNAIHCRDDFPVKTRDVVVGCWLVSETYSTEAINKILAYTAIFGRAHDCPYLDPGDAAVVDDLLAAEAHFFVGM
jgi:hypothetical protein